ncbi:FadR/GntR family transcriptional regulator [Roseburia sp. MSJ-14]|uniref:FadR/GntR family transcriptional regulator n=1 Tax=Roseburia sp. MSJ-14 TaxID=2841514 RepID=UPI001C129359|nr:FadR/GntR family transcriptional regulator [Roseburia sp. MSJ-14]MBU5472284.1 FadR family transcriptional regulator [Roseburia sp. MSJ-14]
MEQKGRLSDRAADSILSMITVEKRFLPGDKLPNENVLSEELKISRTTLREAIRILVTGEILEIRRGRGTFVREDLQIENPKKLVPLTSAKVKARDLYEMRLIFEPEAAYYASLRATDKEIERILSLGTEIEERIRRGKDRTEVEQAFHKSIAKATHNEFMNQLMPVIYEGINKGVRLSKIHEEAVQATLIDHRMLMDFLKGRNAEGARNAMRIHILHAMEQLQME